MLLTYCHGQILIRSYFDPLYQHTMLLTFYIHMKRWYSPPFNKQLTICRMREWVWIDLWQSGQHHSLPFGTELTTWVGKRKQCHWLSFDTVFHNMNQYSQKGHIHPISFSIHSLWSFDKEMYLLSVVLGQDVVFINKWKCHLLAIQWNLLRLSFT